MTQSADDRIFGLIAVAEDQQAAVRAGIEGLALERAALAKDRVTLMQAAEQLQKVSEELTKVVLRAAPQMVEAAGKGTREAIKTALVDVGEDTTRVVTSAAQPTFDRVEDTVKAATTVQLQLWATVREIRRKWTWMVACAVAGGVLATGLLAYGAVWWQSRELERLAGQRDQLIGEINGLQGQADQARRNGGKRPPKAP